jgi:polysaccharide deacetylase 2 family uncharacterized protein YibQ
MILKTYRNEIIGGGLFFLFILCLFGWLIITGEQTIKDRRAHLKPVQTTIALARPETGDNSSPNTQSPKALSADESQVKPKLPTKPQTSHQDSEETKDQSSETITVHDTESQKPVPVSPVEQEVLIPAIKDNSSSQQNKPSNTLSNIQKQTTKQFVSPSIPDHFTKIALIVNGLGQKPDSLDTILTSLPPHVTLSFSPYANNVKAQIEKSSQAGFQSLLQVPMEPLGFPNQDPGPRSLLVGASTNDNIENLEWVLKQSSHSIGVTTLMGSAFVQDIHALTPVLSLLSEKGLIFVDSLAGTGRSVVSHISKQTQTPYVPVDLKIDDALSETEIDKQLRALEIISKEFGYAVGTLSPYPLSLKKITEWSQTLRRNNIALTPISSIHTTIQENSQK